MPTRPDPDKLAAVYDPELGRRRCTASNRSGNRCKRAPVAGAVVCTMHGGAAPQVQRSARQRLAALVEPALDALATVLEDERADHSDRVRAATAVLDRTGYHARVGIDVSAVEDEVAAVLAELDEEP